MAERYPNIYQRARKEAGLTQEQAAERLSVSVETVKAWEQGQRVPKPEDAERMMRCYAAPWLGLAYTRATCGRLGAVPEVSPRELPAAVLALINKSTDLADDYRRLMRIAEDGIIDEAEAPDFDRIAASIQGVIQAAYEVLYAEAWDAPSPQVSLRTTARPLYHNSPGLQGGIATEADMEDRVVRALRYSASVRRRRRLALAARIGAGLSLVLGLALGLAIQAR